MAPPELRSAGKGRLSGLLGTAIIVAIYAAVMISSNTQFTILDDEANGLAVAGRPVGPALRPFLFNDGGLRELHPPETEILWHLWMMATNYSFFWLRVLANLLYIGAVLFTAKCAEGLARERQAYWAALVIGFAWPFAFQYGRIAGWYTVSTFLLAAVTWIYLRLLEDRSAGLWAWFAAACVAFAWSNYFALVFLLLLLLHLIAFHRDLALKRKWPIAMTATLVAVAFAPLLRVAFGDVVYTVGAASTRFSVNHEIATVGYPAFAILASAAVAPWFWPLSVPVGIAAVVLVIAMWRSAGRRWLLYAGLAMLVMEFTGVFDVKRALIFLPWLFIAAVLALFGVTARNRWAGRVAVATMLLAGWMGIASGQHYATTNLREPWDQVARVVARDAREGATVISENPPFFFYLDYQLGLERKTQSADRANLGAELYRANGYTILGPDSELANAQRLRGKVVTVQGASVHEEVEWIKGLNADLAGRCGKLGEYRAAPDPALPWKRRFTRDMDLLAYRTDVTWYDCH